MLASNKDFTWGTGDNALGFDHILGLVFEFTHTLAIMFLYPALGVCPNRLPRVNKKLPLCPG